MKITEQILYKEIQKLNFVISCLKKEIDEIKDTCCSQQPVCQAPSITSQPQSQTIDSGNSLFLQVSVTGTAPFTYQWLKDGANIIGATSSTYTVAEVESADAGVYTVQITNACGVATSSAATITINANVNVFWGWIDPNDPDFDQIEALFQTDPENMQEGTSILSGQNFNADFRDNIVPAYLYVAEPITEPAKTRWYGSVLNNGFISQDPTNPNGDTFVAHTSTDIVTLNPNYRFYISAFPTQQDQTVIEFRTS